VFKPCCTERSSRKRTASATHGSEQIVSEPGEIRAC
jgi:hypothetical protein